MKLILYGLGKGLDLVEKKIRKEHNILGYMDSYSKISVFRGKPFFKLEDIHSISFDFIIIVVRDRKIAWSIYENLVINCRIEREKVIPFYVYANYELYAIKMQSANLESVRGLIFGNSYAECGFLEKELSIPFINLSFGGQDIYYDYKIFHKCIEDYGKRIEKLEYVIIDLYDYYYFNVDVSMMNYAMNYYAGGYLEEHNFKNNHNFSKSFQEELMDRYYSPMMNSQMNKLFYDVRVRYDDGYNAAENTWKHIEKDPLLESRPIIGNAISKRYEFTINENIKFLHLFLKEIKEFNQNIKIIFTLIPKYISMEYATEPFMQRWKKEFEGILRCFCNEYNALFWNYKKHLEISNNYMFYRDAAHMNTVGARALTSILNEDLKKLEEFRN